MCSAQRNSYLSRRTYSDTSAELVEARVGLTSFEQFKTVTTSPEQLVNVSELLKSPARNTKVIRIKIRATARCHKITVRIFDNPNIVPTL